MTSLKPIERMDIYACFWRYLKEIKYNISMTIFVHRYCDDHNLNLYGRGCTGNIDVVARRCGILWHRLCSQLVQQGDLRRVSRDCYVTVNQTGLELWKKHELLTKQDIRLHFSLTERKWEEMSEIPVLVTPK